MVGKWSDIKKKFFFEREKKPFPKPFPGKWLHGNGKWLGNGQKDPPPPPHYKKRGAMKELVFAVHNIKKISAQTFTNIQLPQTE